MRVAIVSKSPDARRLCRREATSYGLVYDERRPDIVLTYGGDGTLLHAERRYPCVPKVALRNSRTCQKCHDHAVEHALDALRRGSYRSRRLPKLLVEARRGSRLLGRGEALNEVSLRNREVERALRFLLVVDGKTISGPFIGDGVVVATPFGSAAYYRSITRASFARGFRFAFNNVVQRVGSAPLRASFSFHVTIVRGPGVVSADNARVAELRDGDRVIVRVSPRSATLVTLTRLAD